jgi:hypothetical protein
MHRTNARSSIRYDCEFDANGMQGSDLHLEKQDLYTISTGACSHHYLPRQIRQCAFVRPMQVMCIWTTRIRSRVRFWTESQLQSICRNNESGAEVLTTNHTARCRGEFKSTLVNLGDDAGHAIPLSGSTLGSERSIAYVWGQ